MKLAELIKSKENELLPLMKDCAMNAMKNPSVEYRIYIDTDGVVNCEEWPQGDNAWYKFDGDYKRYYVDTQSCVNWSALGEYFPSAKDFFHDYVAERFGIEPNYENWLESDEGMFEYAKRTVLGKVPESEWDEWLDSVEDEAIQFWVDDEDACGLFEARLENAITEAEREED